MATEVGAIVFRYKADTTEVEKAQQKVEQAVKTGKENALKVTKALAIGMVAAIGAVAVGAYKFGTGFESAFAGVIKTVDATEAELAQLREGILAMSKTLPASAEDIAAVAEAAGQLGIKTENILSFTRTMIDLGEATNLSATEAATALARFANITGMSQKDFDRLGSAIVELGNNFATTEAEIVDMAMRLAGAGTQAGMTEAEIMGIAAALSSVGIEAEAGGSAFSKVMSSMQIAVETGSSKVAEFAAVAGMTAEEFTKAFKEDAAGALAAFVQGLGNMGDEGESAIVILEEMGITEVRMRDALLRAAGAGDLLTDAISSSTSAWDKNNALTKEAEKRYATTESKVKILGNSLKDLLIRAFDALYPLVQGFVDLLTKAANWMSENSTAVKILAAAVGLITIALIAYNVVQAITAAGGWAMAAAEWAALAPILLIIAAIALLAVGAAILASELKKPALAVEELGDVTTETGEKISEATAESVQAFLDLQDEASQALKTLQWTGAAVSQEMADQISANFNAMADMSIAAVERQRDESLATLRDMFAQSANLTAEEQANILALTEKSYNDQIDKIVEYNNERLAILQAAADENRALTEEENARLLEIEQELQDLTVAAMSESEAEQLAILTHLKENAGELAAEQAAEIVQKANEQKDATIAAAEQEYYDRLAAAEMLRAQGTEEAIAAADAIVAEAQRQYDDTVAIAESNHAAIIEQAQLQAGEHVDLVDWETGELKSKWTVFWEDVGSWFKQAWSDIGSFFQNIWSSISDFFSGLWQGIVDKVNGAVAKIGEIFDSIIDLLKTPINWIIDGINKFLEGLNKIKIPDWVPAVGGKGINIPLIPRLRVGLDYVPFDEYPAMLHRGEAVLTAEEAGIYRDLGGFNGLGALFATMGQPAGSGGSVPLYITVEGNIDVDGYTIGTVMWRHVDDVAAMQGR